MGKEIDYNIKQEKILLAKRLLNEGMSLESIAMFIGLSIDEIKRLKK